jgi:hypothetical protein
MKHIAFITGPADFLNLYSYLQHHEITSDSIAVVLFGNSRNISEGLKSTTRELTGHLTDASFHYLDQDDGADGIYSLRSEVFPTQASPVNLFITHIFGKFVNQLLDIFEFERLILVENGLATYYPPVGRDPRLKQDYYATRPFHKVDEAWLPLASFIGCPFYLSKDIVKSPSVPQFRSAVEQLVISTQFNPAKVETGEKVVFVAGTSLYRLGVISQEEEVKKYENFVLQATQEGFDRIYWKPHPRMLLNPDVWSSISSKVTTLTDHLPLEFHFLQSSGLQYCASIASTSLLFGKHFFAVEPQLISAEFARVSQFPHLTKLGNLFHPRQSGEH